MNHSPLALEIFFLNGDQSRTPIPLFRPGFNQQWLSKLRRRWTSISWQAIVSDLLLFVEGKSLGSVHSKDSTKKLVSSCNLYRLHYRNSPCWQAVHRYSSNHSNRYKTLSQSSSWSLAKQNTLNLRTGSPWNRESNTKHPISAISGTVYTWLTSSISIMSPLGLCALLMMIEPFSSPLSKESSMVVEPSVSPPYIPGILSL